MVTLNSNYASLPLRARKASQTSGYKVTLYLYAKENGLGKKEEYKDERLLSKEFTLPFPPFPGLFIHHPLVYQDGEDGLSHRIDEIAFDTTTGEIFCNLGEAPYLDINEMLANGWRRHWIKDAEQPAASEPVKERPRKRGQTQAGRENEYANL